MHFSVKVESESPAIYSQCSYCQRLQDQMLLTCKWCKKVYYCGEACQEEDQVYHDEVCFGLDNVQEWTMQCKPKQDARYGLTGIRNINNSCYLSSSLQCLSHSIGLTNYFLEGSFTNEINYTNPLGS